MYRNDKSLSVVLNGGIGAKPDQAHLSGKQPDHIKSLGLCLGASTVSVVEIQSGGNGEGDPDVLHKPRVTGYFLLNHEGDPRRSLQSAFSDLDINTYDRVVATGRKFRHFVRMSSIPESQAVEYAYQFVKPPGIFCPAVVSAGGETTMVYVLNSQGRISNVLTGNKCASGTGEFFLQQLRRMDVSLETAAQWANTEAPYPVSGRCSVFCKSDCTHATNKGIPRSKVTAGLCRMMADKILELLKKVERKNIMITGGTARNRMMIEYLSREINGLIVPEEAPYFEALGAALWGLRHPTQPLSQKKQLFVSNATSFDTLAPLSEAESLVTFKSITAGVIRAGDECLLGLDVGSTTTKAVLVRMADNAMLASVYLRTNGDPVGASRQCYRAILNQIAEQVDPSRISICGLGVCGSGRQIAGLHALTEGIVNEIVAHAAAAVYFDPQVDTLFEIGGQDAKYTYITTGVPADYAMNEACSAGTGSFLEESAYETLGVKMEDIADIALKGKKPPNFNDQCAAFIASDIKNAIHEGVANEDIVAGLVYSICMNYANRVKGNRPVGRKIFMQGGVCYNRAVPLAMASLVGKPIIVPPEPGLMGAFGVALEVRKRIETGLMERVAFDLAVLADREVDYREPFVCRGGKEKCDRRCEIARIEIEKKTYPFGGACNRYYNLRHQIVNSPGSLNLVRRRQQLVFDTGSTKDSNLRQSESRGRIGINRSFLVNTYYPLYSTFFNELGYDVVIPDAPRQEGIDQKNAAFCYPAELAHGFFYSLLNTTDTPDAVFLPHFKAVPDMGGEANSQVCPFVQGETFYLQATFHKELSAMKRQGTKVLAPLIDMTGGLADAQKTMLAVASQLGAGRKAGIKAFEKAVQRQNACLQKMKAIGTEVLKQLESDPDQTAVVIFGRPYNAFAGEAHMGIPDKLASRGILVLPLDFLPLAQQTFKRHMYWGMGQLILKAANLVAAHPQLFGTFITNFSCGPDSFLIGYFRSTMGQKPSLTLELDSHTADAGIETRIEAFLDIIADYRRLVAGKQTARPAKTFTASRTELNRGRLYAVTSAGERLQMSDKRVTLLFPSMGKFSVDAISAVFRGNGFNVVAHPPADESILKLGRANTSCKECLPLILTTGTLLNYIQQYQREDEVLAYFMPTGAGPCRFGQYQIFMEDLVERLELPNVAIFSLTSENSYVGLGVDIQRQGWWGVVASDVMEDIRSMILANAVDIPKAEALFDAEWQMILKALESGEFSKLERQLMLSAEKFGRIPLVRPVEAVPKILLTGEIFVRRDDLSRQGLTERLAENGFATICSPIAEWLFYSDYLQDKGLTRHNMSKLEKLEYVIKKKSMTKYEKRIKMHLSRSGLVHTEPLDVQVVIDNAVPYISPALCGEAILTVGSALTEVASEVCGVIAIGPFGCMPNRLSEAILCEAMKREKKLATDPTNAELKMALADVSDLPYLAIESDGSPFPQLIDAKLETFCLRAERLHRKMLDTQQRMQKKNKKQVVM